MSALNGYYVLAHQRYQGAIVLREGAPLAANNHCLLFYRPSPQFQRRDEVRNVEGRHHK